MIPTPSKFSRRVAMAAVMLAALASVSVAQAGSCPADKMRPDGSGEKMNSTPAKAVTDAVLASVDLAKEPAAVKDRLLRLRRLEIKPVGVVPWHEHANRPVVIYIVSGEIMPAPVPSRLCTAQARLRLRRTRLRTGGRTLAR